MDKSSLLSRRCRRRHQQPHVPLGYRLDDKIYNKSVWSCLHHGITGLFCINGRSLEPSFNIFSFGITVFTNGHVMPLSITILSSLVIVALFFRDDGQALSADSDEASTKQSERPLLQQVAVGLLSKPSIIWPQVVFPMSDAHNRAP